MKALRRAEKERNNRRRLFLCVVLPAVALLALWTELVVSGAIEGLECPDLPRRAKENEPLVVRLQLDHPELYEYHWLTKHNKNGWDMSAPWSAEARYEFKAPRPGAYNIQVDIRLKETQEIAKKKWLGQILVEGELVKEIAYRPSSVSLPSGVPIHFLLRLNDVVARRDLEFCVHASGAHSWKTIVDWRPWPLPPVTLEENKGERFWTSLQVDVRLKDCPKVMQRIWLNMFYPYDDDRGSSNNLLRFLLADDFDKFDTERNHARVAEELNLTIHFLRWEYQRTPVEVQKNALEQLAGIEKTKRLEDGTVRVQTASGNAYILDFDKRVFRQEGSALFAQLDLASFSDYRTLFERCDALPEQAVVAAGLTYAVYAGYRYGAPPNYFLRDINNPTGHCGSVAFELHLALRHLGYSADLVSVSAKGSAHIFNQIHLGDGRSYILDSTVGYVYDFEAHDLMKKAVPDPIVLPQVRKLDFLNLQTMFKDPDPKTHQISIFDEYIPGIYPPQPVRRK